MNQYCYTHPSDKKIIKEVGSKVVPIIGSGFNYETATNKPSINGVELIGNKTNEELFIKEITNEEIEKLFKNL